MERDTDSTPKHNRAVRRIEAVLDGVEAADPRYVMGVATLGAEWSFRNLTRREIQPRLVTEHGFAVIVVARADMEVEEILSHVAEVGMQKGTRSIDGGFVGSSMPLSPGDGEEASVSTAGCFVLPTKPVRSNSSSNTQRVSNNSGRFLAAPVVRSFSATAFDKERKEKR